MGVEFRLFLIPRDSAARPDSAAISRLLASLRREHFVEGQLTRRTKPTNDGNKPILDADFAALGAGEALAFFNVSDHVALGLRHPLVSPYTDEDGGSYYDLELRLSDDFITNGNEYIDPIDENCRCGEALGYQPEHQDDLFYSSRIRRTCPRCGEPYRPQDRPVTLRNPMTGEDKPPLSGGLTYRFAIVVDCGKSLPVETDAEPTFTAEFRQACEEALGVRLYEVGEFY